ncbi:F-box protein At5g49610 [Elaeis guineensis]|uniref:F-box/kelch-repeat protein At3g17570 n=1 Tax=Elaeis guineensis var. tenera TaxID=51953 RepID=A0A6I9SG94_ELAGV|nr:putative F-box/kelch-repeat protein At3g17570 [Elaeis guineensis]
MVRRVAKLTDDLVAEILSHLPTKSFFRFQCVSKSWFALSSDPCYHNKFPRAPCGVFINVPVGRFGPPHGGRIGVQYISLSNNGDDLVIDTALSFLRNIHNMEVISSCNGLLLCRSWVPQGGRELRTFCRSWAYVCNPATREWVMVPKGNDRYRFQYLALGFDPRISRHYHVLRVDFQEIPRFMIFSTKTNEWVVSEVSDAKEYHNPQATFFHEIFYATNGLNQVLGIDLEGRVCRRIELPVSDGIECLGHSGGYLHYMLQGKDEIKVWMLTDYCHVEWVLKHCISIRAMLQKHGIPETKSIRILEFHPNVDVVFLLINPKIFSYHLSGGRLEEVYSLHHWYSRGCVVYSPRLLKGFGNEVA